MALKSGFFNSVDGDRKYNADDLSNFFVKLISNGVFPDPSNNLKVVANSGLTVTVKPGYGFINAKYVYNSSDYDLTLDNADTTNPRIDRIVLRYNSTNREITLNILKGTPAAEPEAPDLTRSSTVYEMALANIAIAANASAIATADITDRRGNSTDCGYVYGLIQQIDTTDLFNQYNDAFNTWFENLQTNLTYNARVQRLTYNTTLAADSSEVHFIISNYDKDIDIVSVFVNGLKCIPTVDYSIDNTSQIINFVQTLNAGAVVLVEVLRSVGEVSSPPVMVGTATFENI